MCGRKMFFIRYKIVILPKYRKHDLPARTFQNEFGRTWMMFPSRWPDRRQCLLWWAHRYCTSTGFYSSRGNQVQTCLYIEQEKLPRKRGEDVWLLKLRRTTLETAGSTKRRRGHPFLLLLKKKNSKDE